MNKKWQLLVAGAVLTSAFVAPAVEASTYSVQKGDTLTKIADKHNTSVQSIKEWNRLMNDTIYVNQKLVVANLETKTTAKPATNQATSSKPTATKNKTAAVKPITAVKADVVNTQLVNETGTHTVGKGDTLTKVAQKYNTTVAQLKQWNTLTSDVIYVGQPLTIQGGEQITPSAFPKDQTIEEKIQNQLAGEQLIKARPTASQQERYKTVLAMAKELIGIPYVYGGNTTAGFDCSGFVNYVYSEAGFTITRKSSLDYFTTDTIKVQNPVPGDFVFFKNTYISNISHMGIYVGDNQFIHAGTNGIEVSSLDAKYWADRFVAYKRYSTN